MKKLILLFLLIPFIIGCEPYIPSINQDFDVMGTSGNIIVYHDDVDVASDAINKAITRIKEIDDSLSIYKETSEIYLLNVNKILSNPSEDILFNIKHAMRFGKLSGGSFDITVQPLLELYHYTFTEEGRPPTEDEIQQTIKKVDYSRVMLNVTVEIGEDQKITLGGIAKGYAVDNAINILKENGIKSALVNIGGDMRALGTKPNDVEWNIALVNPRDKNDYIIIIPLRNMSVVTSGDYERYFDEDKRFHHIVDPKTGYSVTELISVTIISSNAMDADAIATSVFVMGEEKGLELIEKIDDLEGLLITSDKRIIKSSGFDNKINN
jgi:FAD:protein FMN transferase